ncbi:endonuclease domain-containing protein [Aquihabitans sp. McL0605]|uniref:endonuclease domain-containing protein n=1 Tax=Aquihabitans sp. McL0605 TaxID=3415671 RepID=UPI003CED5369
MDTHRRVRLPGVTVHRSILLPDLDRTTVAGVPVTSLARTIVDLAPMNSAEVVGRWIDVGIRQHDLDLGDLAGCITRLTVRGRPKPLSAMQAIVTRQPGYDPGRSVLESRAIQALAHGSCPEPVRQHPVKRPDGRSGFIDLAYPRWHIAIELDGWAEHGLRSAFDPDRVRGNDLALLGWTVLRFTWTMTDRYLCETVLAAIAAST